MKMTDFSFWTGGGRGRGERGRGRESTGLCGWVGGVGLKAMCVETKTKLGWRKCLLFP